MKMIRMFALWLMLLSPGLAVAQKWDGPGEQPVVYPLSGDEQLATVPPPARGRVAEVASNYDVTRYMLPGCTAVGGACTGYAANPVAETDEAKFRTHCNTAKVGWFDPILYPGMTNAGHPHLFFGNTGVTKDSTYQSLRTTGDSTCGSELDNRSAYWIPCLMLDPNKCLKSDYQIVYYNLSPASDRAKYVPFEPGMAYVGGQDPADMTRAKFQAEVDANNGRPGQTNFYKLGWIHEQWVCQSEQTQSANAPNPNSNGQPYYRKKDGSWSMVCGDTGIRQEVYMPRCWDGKNLTSPNARYHVRNEVIETNSGKSFCPNGWYRIVEFEFKAFYSVTDAEIATTLFTSSDRMNTDPTKWYNPGETSHNDWFGAWDMGIMRAWMANCNGIPNVTGQPTTPVAKSCIDTQFGDGRQGMVGVLSPDRNSLVVDLGKRYSGIYRWFPVVKPFGAATMKMP